MPVAAMVDTALAACEPEGTVAVPVAATEPRWRVRAYESEPTEVDSIVVFRECERVQALVPGENFLPEGRDHLPRISAVDLDFDGYGDLAFVAMLSLSGSISEYWRFDPAAGRFQPLGPHDTFQVDSARRELVTHVRGGHAGLLWTAERYRFVRGRLARVRAEEQDWSDAAQAYVHTVRELRGDSLVEVRRDTLTREEAERRARADER